MRAATTLLMFCVAALLALGMVMLYSASMSMPLKGVPLNGALTGTHFLNLQLVWCALGLTACVLFAATDYHRLRKLALPLLVASAIGLVLVLIPGIGLTINGARRWVRIGPMNFQPSELAKLAAIIALAAYAEYHQRRMGRFKQGILIPCAVLLVFAGLILRGRDYGTTMLFGAVCALLLLVAGVRWRYILPPLLLACLVLAFAIWHDPVRRGRVLAWLHPEEHVEGKGYQAYQAMLALGSGGMEGRGLGNGRQKTFVPEQHTDFILPVIGEELGLPATLGVVVTFMVIIICGMMIAWRARDPFGTYLACGITFLIGLQAFINIGVVTSLLPNKGLPLPFISYGGSNLLVMLAAVGILLSIARHAIEPEHTPDDPFADVEMANSKFS
jgi:cell division protein FtsW